MIVTAKCTSHAFDSRNAIQYFPGCEYSIDLSSREQRKLVWLRTPRGKWIFQFDRTNASDPQNRIWFCPECGFPFDRFTELGTHSNSEHNKTKLLISKTVDENEALAEAVALGEVVPEAEVLCECGKKLHHQGRCKGTPFPKPFHAVKPKTEPLAEVETTEVAQ